MVRNGVQPRVKSKDEIGLRLSALSVEIAQLVVNYVLLAGMIVHNMYHAFQVTEITNVTKNDDLW